MKILRAVLLLTLFAVAGSADVVPTKTRPSSGPAFTIPTFHCLGVYWSPQGGAAGKDVLVRFRRKGVAEWNEGLPMRYNPIPNTDEDLADYRGSIVYLSPATTYEVQLTLSGTQTVTNLTATTWTEEFPVGATIRIGNQTAPLAFTASGKPDAYRVYDGRGATIDVGHQSDHCISINASNVILRGFTLKGAGSVKNTGKRPIGAIMVESSHNVIIEDCDISDWGRLNPKTGFGFNLDSAVLASRCERVVVQRCKLHHPTWDGSNWHEPKFPTHTAGPQCISLFDNVGNHVFRYNECWSDMEHMFNDIIGGGGANASFRGAPGPDSDIYGNFVSHCWDDGLEVEGSSRNVRVWDNYITQCMNSIGNAPASIGPLYIWRNVVSLSQDQPNSGGMNFLKMGFATSESWMTGHQYIFHNTIFGPKAWLPFGGLGGRRVVKHTVSRNNILHVRAAKYLSASDSDRNVDNSFDYDLYNGLVPQGHEAHGIRGEPVYDAKSGFDPATKVGVFHLAPGSPGTAAGEMVPNFSGSFTGKSPDIGAHQRGAPPIQYGVSLKQPRSP